MVTVQAVQESDHLAFKDPEHQQGANAAVSLGHSPPDSSDMQDISRATVIVGAADQKSDGARSMSVEGRGKEARCAAVQGSAIEVCHLRAPG